MTEFNVDGTMTYPIPPDSDQLRCTCSEYGSVGPCSVHGGVVTTTTTADALTEIRAEIAELTAAYNDLVKAEAKAYDDGHADAKRQAEAERDEAQADLDALLGHHAATERDYATWRARTEAAQAEIARLEARCGELWSGLYGWSTKYEAAESLITEARAEISRLEKLCGELCDAHEAQFIRAEAAEAEQGRLLHGDDGGPEV